MLFYQDDALTVVRPNEDKIILAIILEGKPLTLSDIARKTELTAQLVAYWLPKMVEKGTLLKVNGDDGAVRYQPQPILLADWIQAELGELYTACVERSDEFFVFDQATVDVPSVVRACISQSLRLFCVEVTKLSK